MGGNLTEQAGPVPSKKIDRRLGGLRFFPPLFQQEGLRERGDFFCDFFLRRYFSRILPTAQLQSSFLRNAKWMKSYLLALN